MTSLFDISTYKSAAIAAGLYYVLQTEMASNLIEGVLSTVINNAKRANPNDRDTTPVTVAKAALGVIGFRLIDQVLNRPHHDEEEDGTV